MVRVFVLTAFVVGIACFVSGCAIPSLADPVKIAGAAAPDGSAYAVDVESQAGDLWIRVDPLLKRPVITVRGTEGLGGPRDGVSPATWVAADIAKSDPHPILRILSIPPPGQEGVKADLDIRIPACAGLRVRTQRGEVHIRGARGAVDVQNGDSVTPGWLVSVTFAEPMNAPVMLRSSTGAVQLQLPRGSRANLTIRSGGEASVVLPTETLDSVKSAKGIWEGKLNAGGFDVTLMADRADVSVRLKQ
jgi:hypothetical protein